MIFFCIAINQKDSYKLGEPIKLEQSALQTNHSPLSDGRADRSLH